MHIFHNYKAKMLPLLAFCLIQSSLTSITHAAQNSSSTEQDSRKPRGFYPTLTIPVTVLASAGTLGSIKLFCKIELDQKKLKKIALGVFAFCFFIGIIEFAAYSNVHSYNKKKMDTLLLPAPLPANASIDVIYAKLHRLQEMYDSCSAYRSNAEDMWGWRFENVRHMVAKKMREIRQEQAITEEQLRHSYSNLVFAKGANFSRVKQKALETMKEKLADHLAHLNPDQHHAQEILARKQLRVALALSKRKVAEQKNTIATKERIIAANMAEIEANQSKINWLQTEVRCYNKKVAVSHFEVKVGRWLAKYNQYDIGKRDSNRLAMAIKQLARLVANAKRHIRQVETCFADPHHQPEKVRLQNKLAMLEATLVQGTVTLQSKLKQRIARDIEENQEEWHEATTTAKAVLQDENVQQEALLICADDLEEVRYEIERLTQASKSLPVEEAAELCETLHQVKKELEVVLGAIKEAY